MENEDTTLETQPDASQLNAPGVDGAASIETKPESMTLEEINGFLGKNFKDKPTALASIKETFRFVGQRDEDIIKRLSPNNDAISKELGDIKENLFFRDNPDLSPYRDAYKKIGGNPEAFFNSPEFKPIFEKAKGFDENQKLKSVLVSNPRLAQTKDNLTKAAETTNSEERDSLVAKAVLATIE